MTVVRAAMHVHSDWSDDGRLPLADVARLMADHGYDAVFMCEHDRGFTPRRKRAYDQACAEASHAGSLLIPGIEYGDAEDRIHVPVWGLASFLGEGLRTETVLRAAAQEDGWAVIAHPRRKDAWRIIEPSWLEMCSGIEIWTRKWDGWAPNRWAVQAAGRAGLVGAVSLDLHDPRQAFPLAMELDVLGPVTALACVRALGAGRCRARLGRLPVAVLANGGIAHAASGVERVRRPVFKRGRKARDRLLGPR